jgi:hypothetical protein
MQIPRDDGGAVQIGTTSRIFIPPDDVSLVGIVASEASIRLDVAVPDGMRVGVVDTEADTMPGFSIFVFGRPNGAHEMRCSVNDTFTFGAIPLVLGEWIRLGCTCEANQLQAFASGVKVAEMPGCAPASAAQLGLQIGQNMNVAGGTVDEEMVGAIDDVRLRTSPE